MSVDACDELLNGHALKYEGEAISAPTTARSLDQIIKRGVDFFGVHTGNPPQLYKSGIPIVDETLGGILPGSLSVIAGRTKTGKTSIALWVAINAARVHKESIGLIHLEDELELVAIKTIAMLSGISELKIQSGDLTDIEKQTLKDAERLSADIPIQVADVIGLKLVDVVGYIHDLANKGSRVVIVDYIHCIAQSADSGGNETAHINMCLDQLHQTARETKTALILMAQLNRPKMVWSRLEHRYVADDGTPSVHDIKGSAAIATKARLALVAYHSCGEMKLHCSLSSRGGCENMTERFFRDDAGIIRRIEP